MKLTTLAVILLLISIASSTSLASDQTHYNQHAITLQSGEPDIWTKYPGNPVMTTGQPWEVIHVSNPYVLKDGPIYKMWYAANWPPRIGYATSPDGIAWTKWASNPILGPGSPGAWDEFSVAVPYVIKIGNTYHMWFGGATAGYITPTIGYATSSDGIAWTKYTNNPVLTLGSPGSWEEREVVAPSVAYQNGTYKMWYTGQNNAGRYAIGYATSTNGINWTKYGGNPIITGTIGAWDQDGILAGKVLLDGSVYRMWYFAKDGAGTDRIGYGTSQDGIHWTKYAGNPVLDLGGSGAWDRSSVAWPMILNEDSMYKMWYAGIGDLSLGSKLGYATAKEMHGIYLPVILK